MALVLALQPFLPWSWNQGHKFWPNLAVSPNEQMEILSNPFFYIVLDVNKLTKHAIWLKPFSNPKLLRYGWRPSHWLQLYRGIFCESRLLWVYNYICDFWARKKSSVFSWAGRVPIEKTASVRLKLYLYTFIWAFKIFGVKTLMGVERFEVRFLAIFSVDHKVFTC